MFASNATLKPARICGPYLHLYCFGLVYAMFPLMFLIILFRRHYFYRTPVLFANDQTSASLGGEVRPVWHKILTNL